MRGNKQERKALGEKGEIVSCDKKEDADRQKSQGKDDEKSPEVKRERDAG